MPEPVGSRMFCIRLLCVGMYVCECVGSLGGSLGGFVAYGGMFRGFQILVSKVAKDSGRGGEELVLCEASDVGRVGCSFPRGGTDSPICLKHADFQIEVSLFRCCLQQYSSRACHEALCTTCYYCLTAIIHGSW